MGVGMIVGGIILLVIGIGAYSYLGSLKNQAEQGQSECQSILGQAGQFLSPEINQKCQQAQQYTPAIQAGFYVGIALGFIGFVMIIVGVILVSLKSGRKGTKKQTTNVRYHYSYPRMMISGFVGAAIGFVMGFYTGSILFLIIGGFCFAIGAFAVTKVGYDRRKIKRKLRAHK